MRVHPGGTGALTAPLCSAALRARGHPAVAWQPEPVRASLAGPRALAAQQRRLARRLEASEVISTDNPFASQAQAPKGPRCVAQGPA